MFGFELIVSTTIAFIFMHAGSTKTITIVNTILYEVATFVIVNMF